MHAAARTLTEVEIDTGRIIKMASGARVCHYASRPDQKSPPIFSNQRRTNPRSRPSKNPIFLLLLLPSRVTSRDDRACSLELAGVPVLLPELRLPCGFYEIFISEPAPQPSRHRRRERNERVVPRLAFGVWIRF